MSRALPSVRRLAAGWALAVALSCDATTAPVPGQLSVDVVSPHGHEAAAVLELVGPGTRGVRAVTGLIYTHRAGDTVRVVIMLDPPGKLGLVIRVDDIHRPPAVRLREVADDRNALRPLSGYEVRLEPLGGSR